MNSARQFFWHAMQSLNLAKPKKHRFQVVIDQFLERWEKFPAPRRPSVERGGVGVVIAPWLQTAVPLYSLECARQLAASGKDVTIIWDPADIFDSAADSWEVAQLERVIVKAREEFTVISPPPPAAELEAEPSFFAELLIEGAAQKARGEKGSAELLQSRPALAEGLRRHIGRVRALLRERQFDWLLLPGGVWAVTGVYAQVAAELGLSISTYDCGPGAIFLGHDGVAAQYGDVGAAAQRVIAATASDPAERQRMIAAAQRQLEIRMSGNDEYRLQPIAASATPAPAWDILVLLNLRWDSAALCRQKLFASITDWLTQLLAWTEAHPTARIAIRQHPCEKIPEFRGTDDFGKLLASYPGLAGRAVFLSALEEVNSYDLMAGAKVALPFTSRVGIESTILGTPVILSSRCYYGSCGFTWNPATASEYFALISEALDGKLKVSDAAREAALITYYLAECCLELRTHFTPAPPDFSQWVATPPAQLWASEENQDLLTAMLTRETLVSVRYRRLARRAAEAGAVI